MVTALSRQPLAQTGINASPLEMGARQGKRTVFSTRLCIRGRQWPTQSLTKVFSKRIPETATLSAPFRCTHPPPPIYPALSGSDVTRGKFHAGYVYPATSGKGLISVVTAMSVCLSVTSQCSNNTNLFQ